jgi:hypothetical protein
MNMNRNSSGNNNNNRSYIPEMKMQNFKKILVEKQKIWESSIKLVDKLPSLAFWIWNVSKHIAKYISALNRCRKLEGKPVSLSTLYLI